MDVTKIGPIAPNLNAYAERWAQSVQQECLDHFVVLGEEHLRHIVSEYVSFYNEERPHQGVGNRVLGQKHSQPQRDEKGEHQPIRKVGCSQRLGGAAQALL